MAHPQLRAPTEFVKPGSGQQSLPELDHSDCFLCERGGDQLWSPHVISSPYISESEGKPGWGEKDWQNGSEESWGITLSCKTSHPKPIACLQD